MTNIVKHNEKFGKAILGAAQEQFAQERQKEAVTRVADLLRQKNEAALSKEWCEQVIEFLNRKISAIQKGQFLFDGRTGQFRFHDKELDNTQPERGSR